MSVLWDLRMDGDAHELPMNTITVTSSVHLVLQGQEFTLTIQELELLYGKIGRALGKPEVPFIDWSMIEERIMPKIARAPLPLNPSYEPQKPFGTTCGTPSHLFKETGSTGL